MESIMRDTTAHSENLRFIQEGMDYRSFLSELAQRMNCKTYLEIGVNTGRSLQDITAASIGVDPEFRLTVDVIGAKPMLQLYQMTSDDFFARYDVQTLFGQKFDLAFLDGMHRFEYLLNDFINTEPHSHEKSIILLHDCFPVNAEMTERERNPRARRDEEFRRLWTGDVWKLIPILRKYRPDIEIACTNCSPTGLAVIRKLDACSTVLRDNRQQIVDEFMDQELTDDNIGSYFSANQFVPHEEILNGL